MLLLQPRRVQWRLLRGEVHPPRRLEHESYAPVLASLLLAQVGREPPGGLTAAWRFHRHYSVT